MRKLLCLGQGFEMRDEALLTYSEVAWEPITECFGQIEHSGLVSEDASLDRAL